jgi:aspartyl-tRNA(Asn)/glutamyl-tRNA(Gln) amidotransferase subunit A
MAGELPVVPPAIPVEALRFAVPQTHVLDGLEAEVANAFANACTMLSRAGARIADLPLSELAELSAINSGGGFAPIEAYAWHEPLLERRGSEYDPRVRTRIERASGMTAVEYIRLRAARADLIARVEVRTSGFDALLMPTVAITAPPMAAFERDEDYWRLNALLLRNTSVVNFLDCCAITMPIQTAGPPVGLMIVGEHGADRKLLSVGLGIEQVISRTRS